MCEVSFIIIEYLSMAQANNCIASINRSFIGINYEIIISSNSLYSTEQRRALREKSQKVKWVFNEKNGGFAYAMNRGVANAGGKTIVLLNPDVILLSGINKMYNFFIEHNDVGLIAPKIINRQGVIQDSFRSDITMKRFVFRHLKRLFFFQKRIQNIIDPIYVDWVIGAFMMMSKLAYEKVNGLDEKYFLYCEDMDLCKSMRIKGYKVMYYPKAIIEYEGTCSARHSLKYAVIFLKSLFYYWSKFKF